MMWLLSLLGIAKQRRHEFGRKQHDDHIGRARWSLANNLKSIEMAHSDAALCNKEDARKEQVLNANNATMATLRAALAFSELRGDRANRALGAKYSKKVISSSPEKALR